MRFSFRTSSSFDGSSSPDAAATASPFVVIGVTYMDFLDDKNDPIFLDFHALYIFEMG